MPLIKSSWTKRRCQALGRTTRLSEVSSAPSVPPQLELSESGPRLDSSFVDEIHLDKSFEASSSGAVSPRRSSKRDSSMSSGDISTTRTSDTVLAAPQSSPLPQAPRNSTQHVLSARFQANAGAAVQPQQREDRLPRPSVASVDTVRRGLQPDIPTARIKTWKRQGLWRTFKF